MRREPIVLFDNGSHQCLCFDDLVSGEGVQSNQFLIVDNGQYLLLDPGGDLTYTPLSLELSKRFPLQGWTTSSLRTRTRTSSPPSTSGCCTPAPG